MTENAGKAGSSRKIARTLGLLAFVFTSVVSAVIFLTEDDLSSFDYALMLGAPVALAALFYFVGLRHDPGASD